MPSVRAQYGQPVRAALKDGHMRSILLDTLVSHLPESASPGTCIILLADQSAIGHLNSFKSLVQQRSVRNLLKENAACLDGASPLAIDITGLFQRPQPSHALSAFFNDAKWACAISVVCSALPFDVAVAALRLRCDATLPEDYAVVLRYFDTRILPSLMNVLEANQRDGFLAMASRWLYLNREGLWTRMEPEQADHKGDDLLPLKLTLDQQNALMRACEADTVLALLQEERCSQLLPLPPPEQYRRVQPLVQQANEHGITATSDLILFCKMAFYRQEQKVDDVQWREGLHAVREGKQTLLAMLETLA
jgi:hypothetical protein